MPGLLPPFVAVLCGLSLIGLSGAGRPTEAPRVSARVAGTAGGPSPRKACAIDADGTRVCRCTACGCDPECWCKGGGGGTGSSASAGSSAGSTGTNAGETGTGPTGTNATGTSAGGTTGRTAGGTTATAGGMTTGGPTTGGTGNGNDEDHDEESDTLETKITGPGLISGTDVKVRIAIRGKEDHVPADVEVTLESTNGVNPEVTPIYSLSGNSDPVVYLLLRSDSTHYLPGNSLVLKVRATDEEGGEISLDLDMTVYNRFERLYASYFDFDYDSLSYVRMFGQYTSHYKRDPWAQVQAQNAIRDATVLFVSSHGFTTPSFLISTAHGDWNDPTNHVFPSHALTGRAQAAQLKLPPMSLAFLFTCYTGAGASPTGFYQSMLLSDFNASANRASVQWKLLAYTGWTERFTNLVFLDLGMRKRLGKALYDHRYDLQRDYNFDPNPNRYPKIGDILKVEGDDQMTLRGLYVASDQEMASGVWFKVVRE